MHLLATAAPAMALCGWLLHIISVKPRTRFTVVHTSFCFGQELTMETYPATLGDTGIEFVWDVVQGRRSYYASAVVCYDAVSDIPSLSSVQVVNMSRERIPLEVSDLVKRYLGGESENALAKSLGVSRNVIERRLRETNIKRRGGSASMFLRMSQTSPEERSRLAFAAHEAVR